MFGWARGPETYIISVSEGKGSVGIFKNSAKLPSMFGWARGHETYIISVPEGKGSVRIFRAI